MAKKISQLTQATEVKSDDVTVIVQDGETKKLPLNMMVTKQDIENKKIAGLAKLDEIEATYENDTYTPTITVKNKSSVKVGEGDGVDYSANVMDGHVKSAILSGNTLVNLLADKGEITLNSTHRIEMYDLPYILTKNKKYLLCLNVKSIDTPSGFGNVSTSLYSDDGSTTQLVFSTTEKGYHKSIFTTDDKDYTTQKLWVFVRNGETTQSIVDNIMLLEYQEGMENWDIPYFTGMQSVKMPVLTTTGKNLFDNKIITDYIIGEKDGGYIIDCYKLYKQPYILEKPLTGTFTFTYTTKEEAGGNNPRFIFYFSDGTKLESYTGAASKEYKTHSVIINDKTITKIGSTYSNLTNIKWIVKKDSIQLEQNTEATSYEPYKSNILSANEEVTLRGVGEVKDELNLLTGELTQRIGEVVLDGSDDEGWDFNGDRNEAVSIISNKIIGSLNATNIICADFVTSNNGGAHNIELIRLSTVSGKVIIHILKSKLGLASDITDIVLLKNSFKAWLSQNPLIVQYELETESVKTVDLMPSGTHSSTTPYCWKNGHIQLSSSGLLPSLEYSVATSRAGQISQNAAMIVKNDKRIFDLEILLAGGLVNTTYQALTLQNQVETGLSKVSLSSEKEPDYLLYHMIMKLIEEKAYKLDDLAEKVSVFYLYEKLSDEQFETIYSELYPFVEEEYIELPEDGEIIEEPIVDEVLEEVENGVVM